MLMVLATNSSATSSQTTGAREDVEHVGRQAAAGDPADARADRLDRDHHRPGQHHRPKQAEAGLRAGLRIGGDAAGVVVGGAGDDARAEALGEVFQGHGHRKRRRLGRGCPPVMKARFAPRQLGRKSPHPARRSADRDLPGELRQRFYGLAVAVPRSATAFVTSRTAALLAR